MAIYAAHPSYVGWAPLVVTLHDGGIRKDRGPSRSGVHIMRCDDALRALVV